MSALSGPNRSIVQRWCGTIRARQEDDYAERFERLGSAYAVALEVCMQRLADFRLTATEASSADDRTSHSANIKAAENHLGELAGFLNGNSDVSLGVEGEAMLSSALGTKVQGLTTVDVSVDNSRND